MRELTTMEHVRPFAAHRPVAHHSPKRTLVLSRTGARLTKWEPNRVDFFEHCISTASLVSNNTVAAVLKCNGFQHGTHTL